MTNSQPLPELRSVSMACRQSAHALSYGRLSIFFADLPQSIEWFVGGLIDVGQRTGNLFSIRLKAIFYKPVSSKIKLLRNMSTKGIQS